MLVKLDLQIETRSRGGMSPFNILHFHDMISFHSIEISSEQIIFSQSVLGNSYISHRNSVSMETLRQML